MKSDMFRTLGLIKHNWISFDLALQTLENRKYEYLVEMIFKNIMAAGHNCHNFHNPL